MSSRLKGPSIGKPIMGLGEEGIWDKSLGCLWPIMLSLSIKNKEAWKLKKCLEKNWIVGKAKKKNRKSLKHSYGIKNAKWRLKMKIEGKKT